MGAHMFWNERLLRWLFTGLAAFWMFIFVSSTGWVWRVEYGSQPRDSVTVTSGAIRVMIWNEKCEEPDAQSRSKWSFMNSPPGPTRWFLFWRPVLQASSGVSIYIVPFWIISLPFAALAILKWCKLLRSRRDGSSLVGNPPGF